MILTIRSDNPEAEISLCSDDAVIAVIRWQAHRELSVTLHTKIEELLQKQHKTIEDITGIICFSGPGSFTGLRIGLSVGNALAYALNVPIVATNGSKWITLGLKKLKAGENDEIALPVYGSEPNITKPRG